MVSEAIAKSRDDDESLSPTRLVVLALLLAFLSGTTSLLKLQSWSSGGITILWPSNGFLAAALLCARRRHWPAYLAVGFAVDFAVKFTLSTPTWVDVYLSGCNMMEVWLAAAGLWKPSALKPDLT